MRHVAPIALADLKPASLAGRSEPMFDRIAPGDLLVDERYQRDLTRRSAKLIRSIVEGFDWLKFKPPVVALTERGFEVVDGQHSCIAAACHPEIETIPVIVVDGTDLPRRARAFVSHALDRLAVTPAQALRAAVTGGDPLASEMREVMEGAGVIVPAHNPENGVYTPGQTLAIGAIRGMLRRRGAERSREVLAALARAELAPITAMHIRVADALLCDPEYAPDFDAERITAAMRALTPATMAETRELAAAKRLPMWRALTATLYRRNVTKRARVKGSGPDRVPLPVPERLGTRIKPPPGAQSPNLGAKIVMPSRELAAVVGAGPVLRSDAVAALWRHIEGHELRDPADRAFIVADWKLRAIFGRERVSVSELEGLFASHLRAAA